MTARHSLLFLLIALAAGCSRIESGFRYEYTGHVYKPDGKSGVKGMSLRMARIDAPDAPDLAGTKVERDAKKYVDKADKIKSSATGHYTGSIETVQGWSYSMFMGDTIGSATPPLPPPLPEVIVYASEPGTNNWKGYRIPIPPENQSEAYPRVRKIRIPDLVWPGPGEPLQVLERTTTQPTTSGATSGAMVRPAAKSP